MASKIKWARLPAAVLSLCALAAAQEKWSYPGCPDVTANDFKKVILVDQTKDPTLLEPIKMAIANDGRIFFAERTSGKLKLRKTDGTVVVAAALTVFGQRYNSSGQNNEMGLQGVTLDPQFDSNHYLYLDYAPATPNVWRISRFTLNGEAVDKASEKVILEIPVQRKTCCHTGGGMMFDGKGDLWVSLGNNTTNPGATDSNGYVTESDPDGDDQGHASNTNDLRGKVIRIHPTADGKYTIPDGNLFPPGTAKTRPEIYAMGMRNPYTLFVDKLKGWLTWGDIGPDNNWDTEEYNLFKQPGYAGWPYFAGAAGNAHYAFRKNKNPAAPVNNSPNNTGLQNLPPARGAIIGYRQSAAVTGPIYRYDGSLNSTVKLPPHFDGKWFLSDFNQNIVKVATIDSTGDKVTDNRILFAPGKFVNPLQMTVGPEGALYVLAYAGFFTSTAQTSIVRMEYTGTCLPNLPSGVACVDAKRASPLLSVNAALSREINLPSGIKGFRLYDLSGKLAWAYLGTSSRIALPASLSNGLYRVKYLD